MWATGERILLLAAVAFCCLSAPAAASFPGHNGSIAFRSSSESDGIGIFTVRPDGSAFASLAPDAFDPAWSPDGSRIAFISEPDSEGPTTLLAMNEDGSGMVAVEENAADPSDPSWAPNGTTLAWTDLVPAGSVPAPAILAKDVGDPGIPRRLATLSVGSTISGVAWSPDGSTIAFVWTRIVCGEVSCSPPTIELAVIPATGGAPRTLDGPRRTETVNDTGDVAWSPDGSRIAVSFGPGDLRVVSAADGDALATIVPGAAFATSEGQVAWSPDGSRLALVGELAGSEEGSALLTVSPTGTAARAVSAEPVFSGAIDWQPLQPPVTTITAGPAAVTEDRSARFQFVANKRPATFECRVDARPWARCASGVQYTGLTVGPHVFAVRATESHGVVEERPPQRAWRIESTPLIERRRFPDRTGIRARWFRYVYPRHMVQLRALRAVNVPAGVRIDVRCEGPGCPTGFHRRWRTRRFRASKPVIKGLGRSRLLPRAAVFVTLTKSGYVGIGKMYCVRYNRTVRVRPFTLDRQLPRCGPPRR